MTWPFECGEPLSLVHSWELLMKREPLERLQAEGLQGLQGVPTQLRFRKKNPPELLEMELMPRGTLHPACLPELPPPCLKCEGRGLTLPDEPILDAATLPQDLDLFRLEDGLTVGAQASSSGISVRSSSSSGPSGRQPGGGGLARSASPALLTRS